jgi:hypothetical protein
MGRGYQIIHLYDKPLHPRPSFGPRVNGTSDNGLARLVCCLTIILATTGFFWLYDAAAHRQRSALPMRSQSSSNRPPPQASTMPLTALVPDMNSPQVAFANADVEVGDQQMPDKLDEATGKISEVPKAEAKMPKKQKSRMVKRPPQNQGMQNSAFGFQLFQSPLGQN